MKPDWTTIGIAAISAAVLFYPAIKLCQFVAKKMQGKGNDTETHVVRAFSPPYRGKIRSDNRQTDNGHNGPVDLGHA